MEHAMQRLVVGASNVMNSKDAGLQHMKRIATLDDKMVGTTLASEIMAAAKMEPNIWRTFAVRLMNVTAEARAAFLSAIKADKGAITKGQIEFGLDDKLAKKRTNSATTRVSEMQSFANAWNTGATLTGLMEYANKGLPSDKHMTSEDECMAHLGYTVMLEYARTFSKSKAGRPSKTWLEKVSKFLSENTPDEDDLAAASMYASMVKMVNAKNSGGANATPF